LQPIFNNGKFHIVGFTHENALNYIDYLLNNVINQNYYNLEKLDDNRYTIKIIYSCNNFPPLRIHICIQLGTEVKRVFKPSTKNR
jgi:hypothetical protein